MNKKTKYYTMKNADVTIEKGIITKCSYDFANTDIIIPEILDNQKVLEIANFVFRDKGITNIELPKTLITIGDWTFAINQLTDVNIPKSVKTIGDSAFAYNKLENITIPKGVFVGCWAFYNNNLTKVNIPKGVILGDYAFEKRVKQIKI